MRSLLVTAVLLSLGVSPLAFADGKFNLAMTGGNFFTVLDAQEQDSNPGVVEGTLHMSGGAYDFQKFVSGNRLYLDIGSQHDWLDMTQDHQTTVYYGPLWIFDPSRINAYDRGNGKGFDITGKIGNIDFKAYLDTKKSKASLYWDNNLSLEIKKVTNEAGGCKGDILADSISVVQIRCHSSGSQEDAIFKDPQAFIAYIVHVLLIPDPNQDDGGIGGGGGNGDGT